MEERRQARMRRWAAPASSVARWPFSRLAPLLQRGFGGERPAAPMAGGFGGDARRFSAAENVSGNDSRAL